MTRIETDRLILREFDLPDAQAVFAFGSHPKVTRYTGDAGLITSVDDARDVILNAYQADYRKHGFGRLAVVVRETQQVIGFCGLKYLDDLGEVDIGYRFLPEFWGRGIATEAAMAVKHYGRESLRLESIVGLVLPENVASQRVLQKIGLHAAETITLDESDSALVYREPKG